MKTGWYACQGEPGPPELVHEIAALLWSEEGLKEMADFGNTFRSTTLDNNLKGAFVRLHSGAVEF